MGVAISVREASLWSGARAGRVLAERGLVPPLRAHAAARVRDAPPIQCSRQHRHRFHEVGQRPLPPA